MIIRVKQHKKDHDKGSCTYETVIPHVNLTAERARKLRRTTDLPEVQTPCSELYLLIEAIRAEDTTHPTPSAPSR
jgi:hypothetical protein